MGATTIALGALSAVSAFANTERNRNLQKTRASDLKNEAASQRKRAALEEQKGRIEAENFDRQKSLLHRDFNAAQGRNRAALGTGNVDMTSGSALDVSLGNIDRFAADVGENAYQKALRQWETSYNVKNAQYQAGMYDAQSSYLKKTSGNIGTSLLNAGLAAGTSMLLSKGLPDSLFSS